MTRPDDDSTAIATYMNKQMTSGDSDFNRLSESIYQVFGSLKQMSSDTQIYNAKKGKSKEKLASRYIKSVAENYLNLKDQYNILFNIGEQTDEKEYLKQESKLQSHDDLIAEPLRDIKKNKKIT